MLYWVPNFDIYHDLLGYLTGIGRTLKKKGTRENP